MGLRKVSFFGQPYVLPFEEATGSQIKQQLGMPADRTLAMRTDRGLVEIPDDGEVKLPEGAELVDIPFHEYGASKLTGRRIRDEVEELRRRYGHSVRCGFDQDLDRWWVLVPNLTLPRGWKQRMTPVVITVTDRYPMEPPDGFLLSNSLCDIHGYSPAHYYGTNGRHPKLTAKGYGWFCLHLTNWQRGYTPDHCDSIAKFLTLIELALAKVVQR